MRALRTRRRGGHATRQAGGFQRVVPPPDDDVLGRSLRDGRRDAPIRPAAGYEWYEVSNCGRGQTPPACRPTTSTVLDGLELVGARSGSAQSRLGRALVERGKHPSRYTAMLEAGGRALPPDARRLDENAKLTERPKCSASGCGSAWRSTKAARVGSSVAAPADLMGSGRSRRRLGRPDRAHAAGPVDGRCGRTRTSG